MLRSKSIRKSASGTNASAHKPTHKPARCQRPVLHKPQKSITMSNRTKLQSTKKSALVPKNTSSIISAYDVAKSNISTINTPQPTDAMNDCDSGCLNLDGSTPVCQFKLQQHHQIPPINIHTTPAAQIDPSQLSVQDCLNVLAGKVVEVEGNIGCGKSTLTKMMAKILNNHQQGIFDEVTVASLSKKDTTTTDIVSALGVEDPSQQPFAYLHGELVNQLFLSSFYADSQRYGFAFQMYMLTTRLYQRETAFTHAKQHGSCQLLDRGAVGDALFALYNASCGNISDNDLAIYKSVCADRLPTSLSNRVDVVLYLDVSPLECFHRINNMRQRDSEKDVVPDYIDGIDLGYFELMIKWLGHRRDACGGIDVGLPPTVVFCDWSEFGCSKAVLQKVARAAISHDQRVEYLRSQGVQFTNLDKDDIVRDSHAMLIRPQVTFLKPGQENLLHLSQTTTVDIVSDSSTVTQLYESFIQNKQLIGRDGLRVQHLVIDWSLPHDNAFRRLVCKLLAQEGSVTFYNSDHQDELM